MEKEIKIKGDSGTVFAVFRDGEYWLRVISPGSKLPKYIKLTEDQIREIRIVLDELLQHTNKQDW